MRKTLSKVGLSSREAGLEHQQGDEVEIGGGFEANSVRPMGSSARILLGTLLNSVS